MVLQHLAFCVRYSAVPFLPKTLPINLRSNVNLCRTTRWPRPLLFADPGHRSKNMLYTHRAHSISRGRSAKRRRTNAPRLPFSSYTAGKCGADDVSRTSVVGSHAHIDRDGGFDDLGAKADVTGGRGSPCGETCGSSAETPSDMPQMAPSTHNTTPRLRRRFDPDSGGRIARVGKSGVSADAFVIGLRVSTGVGIVGRWLLGIGLR